jgi:hypothetical protein
MTHPHPPKLAFPYSLDASPGLPSSAYKKNSYIYSLSFYTISKIVDYNYNNLLFVKNSSNPNRIIHYRKF